MSISGQWREVVEELVKKVEKPFGSKILGIHSYHVKVSCKIPLLAAATQYFNTE